MVRGACRYVKTNAVAFLALFVSLGGAGAYAANTIGSRDIIDDEIRAVDVRDDTLQGGGLAAQDLRQGSVRSGEVLNDTARGGGLAADDLRPGSVGASEVADGELDAADIADTASLGPSEIDESSLFNDDSLTGADIDEKTLERPIYARIGPDGTVQHEGTSGITQSMVYKPAGTTGIYCFKDLPFRPTTGMAVAQIGTVNPGVVVAPSGWPAGCSDGDRAKVQLNYYTGAATEYYFTVWFTDNG